jgi:hypothetical protein
MCQQLFSPSGRTQSHAAWSPPLVFAALLICRAASVNMCTPPGDFGIARDLSTTMAKAMTQIGTV